ncbi:MAG: PD-(D/E)XK nuclease family protein [Prolixibacteraceae bacterium]|nr:PD-(D/E)XK nuclease family protein [Prolixibacteraceae bacterium]MBN2649828.1 PD-(D/E)XK nuclease family protein [Prolixibacteraceae bacterium]
MDKFLKEVSVYIHKKFQNEMGTLTMVFPNRRAGLFFQKYLADIAQSPVFSPHIITIAELISDLGALKIADQGWLIIELHRVFKQVTGSNESLDDFYYWGEMMLADFNDIDKYLVDAKQLFSNIESLKEIDNGFDFLTEEQFRYLSAFWGNILQSANSDSKARFMELWRKLYDIYLAFGERLEKLELAYEGMLYRKVANSLPELSAGQYSMGVAFVGFNALNRCENLIFDFFKNNSEALFFWDYDDYYMNFDGHEAAMFMHQNLLRFPVPADFNLQTDNFKHLDTIDVLAVPGFTGQASYAAQWIDKLNSVVGERFDETAVVLCDETLLMPFINVVPANVGAFNVTMGLPVKSSPVYAMVKALVDTDRHSRMDKNGRRLFYHRNLMSLLNNPLMKVPAGDFVDDLNKRIIEENLVYLDASDFSEQPFLKEVVDLPEKPECCRDYLLGIIRTVFDALPDDEQIVKESLYQLHLVVSRLHDSLFGDVLDDEVDMSKKLFYQLLLRQLERLSIPFEGEPLSGLQIMGFLETRSLDFDHLILLSFNDDKLPGNPNQHSFIPYTLRKGFDMPLTEHKNAMYAYYFYRLIQRAKKVSLVYDSRTEGLSRGEVSRFATQLKYEAKHLKVNEKQGVFNFMPSLENEIRIEKTDALLKKIETHLRNKVISPSALNQYLYCSLRFFFRYIEDVKEPDEVLEDIDNLVFGRIAHLALEELYKPFVGKTFSEDDIARLMVDERKLNQSLKLALETEYFKKGKFNLNGRNLLVFDIIKKFVLRVLRYDKSIAPFDLLSLEKNYHRSMTIETQGKQFEVKYGGTVDRLDRVGDKIRVVDYKTGASEGQLSSIEKLFLREGKNNKAAFQTMLYADAVQENMKTDLPLMPAVYGARAVFASDFNPFFTWNKTDNLIFQAHVDDFRAGLKSVFIELMDPLVPFVQIKEATMCGFCPYKSICKR